MAYHAVVADDEVDLSRRKFLTRATIATGAVGAAFAAVPFIESWNPSERARAQGATTQLHLSTPPTWAERTDRVARTPGHDELLRDPRAAKSAQPPYARSPLRSRSAEFLVLIGTCTHL